MSNFPENPNFPAVRQLTRDDYWQAIQNPDGSWGGEANELFALLVERDAWLKQRVGIQGTWDMSPSIGPAEPVADTLIEATYEKISDDVYRLTPTGGVKATKSVGSGKVIVPASAKWSSMVAPNAGGNLYIAAFIYANQEASDADAIDTIFMGALVGTCTAAAMIYLDVGGAISGAGTIGVFYENSAGGSNIGSAKTFVHGMTNVRAGIHSDGINTTLTIDNESGAPEEILIAGLSLGENCRIISVLYFATETPSFPDGFLTFDFGDSTGGRLPLQSELDPLPPAGASDGRRYLANPGGNYGGRSAAPGDVAEFHSGLTKIQVTPGIPLRDPAVNMLIAEYLLANPQTNLLHAAKLLGAILDIANDDTQISTLSILARGHVVFVGGAPTGAFAGFTPMQPIIYDGAAWQQYAVSDFAGAELTFSIREFVNPVQIPAGTRARFSSGETQDTIFSGVRTVGAAGVTVAALGAAGVILLPPQTNALTVRGEIYGSGSQQIDFSTAQYYAVIIDGDTALDISGPADTVGYVCYLSVANNGAAVHKLTLTGGGFDRYLAPSETAWFLVLRQGLGGGLMALRVNERKEAGAAVPKPTPALNTVYAAEEKRILVQATVRCSTTLAGGVAYVQAFHAQPSVTPPFIYHTTGIVGIENGVAGEDNSFQITFVVPEKFQYEIRSTVLDGSVVLTSVFETPL